MLWTELTKPCAEASLELIHGVVALGTVGPLPFSYLAFFTARFMASPAEGCGPQLPGLYLVLEGGKGSGRCSAAQEPSGDLW